MSNLVEQFNLLLPTHNQWPGSVSCSQLLLYLGYFHRSHLSVGVDSSELVTLGVANP